jgi:hypothetical protein
LNENDELWIDCWFFVAGLIATEKAGLVAGTKALDVPADSSDVIEIRRRIVFILCFYNIVRKEATSKEFENVTE